MHAGSSATAAKNPSSTESVGDDNSGSNNGPGSGHVSWGPEEIEAVLAGAPANGDSAYFAVLRELRGIMCGVWGGYILFIRTLLERALVPG